MSRAASELLSVHVPFTIRKRGGRKMMVLPENAPAYRPRGDELIVKALARAYRWRKLLESGQFTTLEELARHEGISASYVSRLMQLNLLAPAIVEAIVEGRQPPELKLKDLLEPFPVEWEGQGDAWFRQA